jgi:hypothetical protein
VRHRTGKLAGVHDTPEVDNQNVHRARNGLFDLRRIIDANLSG